MIKIIICGYRDWAKEIIEYIKLNPKVLIIDVISDIESFRKKTEALTIGVDLVLFLGWSWIVPESIVQKVLCLGIHPSDLPKYRGGSPIQNQILDGVLKSKVCLITLSPNGIDVGDIWEKEDLDLSGRNVKEIFKDIVNSSKKLLERFFDAYPSITPLPQNLEEGTFCKRRNPTQSRIQIEHLQSWSLVDIYNHIRCLTDPYPNAYIEDDFGNRLVFHDVSYVKNQKS
jgi:methionyl-tRNA formyltransferase